MTASDRDMTVLRTDVCGSDVHFVLNGSARMAYTPIVLGPESLGVVEALDDSAIQSTCRSL